MQASSAEKQDGDEEQGDEEYVAVLEEGEAEYMEREEQDSEDERRSSAVCGVVPLERSVCETGGFGEFVLKIC